MTQITTKGIDRSKLALLIEREVDRAVDLHVYSSTPSTQLLALDSSSKETALHVTDHQDQGRGRNGRSWQSEPNSQILLSFVWWYENVPRQLSALSLMLAVELLLVIEEFSEAKLELKWPNDVYLNGDKLAGLLVDVSTSSSCKVVIGLGLNVSTSFSSLVDGRKASDLSGVGLSLCREELIAKIINRWCVALDEFLVAGFSEWRDTYNSLSLYIGELIELKKPDLSSKIKGVYKGVSDEGCLLIETESEVIDVWDSEYSLRPVKK